MAWFDEDFVRPLLTAQHALTLLPVADQPSLSRARRLNVSPLGPRPDLLSGDLVCMPTASADLFASSALPSKTGHLLGQVLGWVRDSSDPLA